MDTNSTLNTSFDELVFENRNKNYGAYQIRKSYSGSLMKAVVIATSIFAVAIGSYFINMPDANAKNIAKVDDHKQHTTIVILGPDQKKPIEKIKTNPPPKGPNKPDLSSIIIVRDSAKPVTPSDTTGTSTKGKLGGTGKVTGDTTGTPCIGCDSIKKKIAVVDHLKNGDNPKDPGLDAFFTKNIKYPVMAREQGIEGTVWLSFIVDTKGNVRDITIFKGANPLLDREVLRVAKFMPKWEPVYEDGELVEFLYRKPVRFRLQN